MSLYSLLARKTAQEWSLSFRKYVSELSSRCTLTVITTDDCTYKPTWYTVVKVCTLASISPQFQPSTMCYVGTVYHLVRVSGSKQFSIWTPDLDDPPFPRVASEKVETRGKWKPVSISLQQYIMLRGGGGQDRVVLWCLSKTLSGPAHGWTTS